MTCTNTLARMVLPLAALVPANLSAQNAADLRLLTNVPFDPTYSNAIVFGDVDGDGDLDVLSVGSVLSSVANTGTLWLGNGRGQFVDASSQLPALPLTASDVELDDLDGDGDLDALIAIDEFSGPTMAVLWLNDGTGRFQGATSQLPATSGLRASDLALGDFDGDGDVDALLASRQARNWLWTNDGNGNFTSRPSFTPMTSSVTAVIEVADVDGDGDLDALVGNETNASRVWVNDGSGRFSDGFRFPLPAFVTDIAAADVDRDGDVDALMGALGGVFLFLNQGSGAFVDASTQIPAGSGTTPSVALADADGDLLPEAFLGNTLVSSVQVWKNDGGGSFSAAAGVPASPTPRTAVDLATGDVDADGDVDVAIAASAGEPDRLWMNDGSAGFTDLARAAARIPETPARVWSHAAVDIDGDLDLDVIVGRNSEEALAWKNDGSGRFSARPLGVTSTDTAGIAAGDVDGDGDNDLMLDALAGVLAINDGAGNFVSAVSQLPPVRSNFAFAHALADVDGDSDLDILVATGVGENELWRNDGSGTFSQAARPTTSTVSWGVVTGDVDADGDADAVFLNGPRLAGGVGGELQLWINDGAGRFTERLLPNSDHTRSGALADLDGDNDRDLITFGTRAQLFRNDGTGVFKLDSAQSATLTKLMGTFFQAAVTDADGDNDLDVLSLTATGTAAFLNDGAGSFSAGSVSPDALQLARPIFLLADLDSDADPDVVIQHRDSTNAPPYLLTNMRQQVALARVPRVGRPLELDIAGPLNGAWGLLIALSPIAVPLPPLGVFRLDPTLMALVGSGSLDPSGRARWTIQVPPDPTLVGGIAYFQGLTAQPLRLTNLEPAMFFGF